MKVTAKVRNYSNRELRYCGVRLDGKKCYPVTTCSTSRQVFRCGDYILKLDHPDDNMPQTIKEIDGYESIPNVFKHLVPKMVDYGQVQIEGNSQHLQDIEPENLLFIVVERIRGKNFSSVRYNKTQKKPQTYSNIKKKYSRGVDSDSAMYFMDEYIRNIAMQYDEESFANEFLLGDLHDDNIMLTKDRIYIVDMGF